MGCQEVKIGIVKYNSDLDGCQIDHYQDGRMGYFLISCVAMDPYLNAPFSRLPGGSIPKYSR